MPYPQDDLVSREGASEGKNQKQDRNNDEQCFFHGITLLGTVFDSLTNEHNANRETPSGSMMIRRIRLLSGDMVFVRELRIINKSMIHPTDMEYNIRSLCS